jgi:hypothetical protein
LRASAASLAPPLIGILQRHGVGSGGEHQLARIVDAFLGEHPLDPAKRVAEVASRPEPTASSASFALLDLP